MPETAPRFMFFNGGCRTILTTNFGEHFCHNQTRYYSGWVYSPGCDYGRFCYDIFTRWIKGSQDDPAPEEFDVTRLEDAYRFATNRGTRAQYHPRLMDRFGRTTADMAAPVDAADRALS
jgi:hypothetical protein